MAHAAKEVMRQRPDGDHRRRLECKVLRQRCHTSETGLVAQRQCKQINRCRYGRCKNDAADPMTYGRQRANRHRDLRQVEKHGASSAKRHGTRARRAGTSLNAAPRCIGMQAVLARLILNCKAPVPVQRTQGLIEMWVMQMSHRCLQDRA